MNKREAKLDKLFRAAIKAETGATSVKLTSTEAFIMRPNTYGRRHIGPRDSVSDWLERPNTGCHVRGHSNEAAAYRAALNL
ncbi:hypothetical protein GV68_13680 [Pseudorhizobium pelagicum]|uniref:Uncharacterized protein n=2 Tax=Pseudorhizobium pelagicum TaxID=1509405 RepID=A0A922P1D9_9HYPH|nr:hypothetical protein GV68_13680 [Pseudorhizobium pelagicum]